MEEGVEKEIKIVEEKLEEEMRGREELEGELNEADKFIEELKNEN